MTQKELKHELKPEKLARSGKISKEKIKEIFKWKTSAHNLNLWSKQFAVNQIEIKFLINF